MPKLGSVITTSDGKRLGRIDDIHQATKREAASVGIIYDGHFVFVPVSTLTAGDQGYTTSLSLKEVAGR
jgi:sporulation protein YlmC with PRC-barrel domain